ncbi:methyl-accepting chemotaxis protein [Massilia sp. DWR3-1-1]|uniref:methyl-accepting chemotaxis protein n=1 Tax=Massilia sp. DWR3-1-1 TaxID=2804559 RepID=UPI003CF6CF95
MTTSTLTDSLRQHARSADRLMCIILWGLFVMALALSPLHDTLSWALLVGFPAAAIPTALVLARGGRRSTAMVAGGALMVFAALHIHQAAGATELHFGIFVLLAFLLCYRDPMVVVVAAAVIALHHLSFSYLQELGYGVRCMSEPGFKQVLIHASYVVVESAVLCYLALLLRREAVQAAELGARVATMSAGAAGTIDLRGDQAAANSPAGKSLDGMMVRLHDAVAQVQVGVDAITCASEEIAHGNQDLSNRTERQAVSLQGTVTTVGVLSERVRQSGDNARRANDLAISASSDAVRGGKVVAEVVDTMASINESSRRIVDIIAVIDGIAFQTNILALNAAVEAARAGEQGRGFAVVASEVRNLAQRSAAAAKEIKQLIGDSVGRVEAGTQLVDLAGARMQEIVASVAGVCSIIGEISEASELQVGDIGRIHDAIEDMDSVTQQNAALVEEASAASASLHQQAASLGEIVARFTLQAPADERASPRAHGERLRLA